MLVLALTGWREEVPTAPMVVATVEPSSPAESAGVRAGDVIVSVEGPPIRDVHDLTAAHQARGGRSTTYVLRRGDEVLSPVAIVPRDVGGGRGVIGVTPKLTSTTRRLPIADAARA